MLTDPRYAGTLAFLRRWVPQGIWLLSAIDPNTRQIESRSFDAQAEQDEAENWVRTHGASRNLYFSINTPKQRMASKAAITDIASVDWLHVDIDVREGLPIGEELARIRAMLEAPPEKIPVPSVVIFSGGGYQAFWRLREPVMIANSTDAARMASFNLRLEHVLGGDHCHNIDRIARLPGTLNRPDAKKTRRGRVLTTAMLHAWTDTSFELSQFRQALLVQDKDAGFATPRVNVSANIPRLSSIDELPKSVSDYCRAVIVHGHHPLEAKKYPSRSEWLFYVVCELVRSGCDDDLIYSVITDPQFGIAESVIEKKRGANRYARRQIERAREEAIHPELRALNEKHAVIGDLGGRCRIVTEVWDEAVGRYRLSRQTFEDFHNRYGNQNVEVGTDKHGGPVYMALGKWWTRHANRRQYETLTFSPNRDIDGAYNLWRGFGCEAREGDCSKFLAHVRDVICRGDEANERYLLDWMACAVQRPHEPGRIAVVLKGRMGSGKSIFARYFGSLFGRHFLPITDAKHLTGAFNAHLEDCVVLFADEAFASGLRQTNVLKGLVTEDTLVIEPKGVDVRVARNCVHLVMGSDAEWAVPVGLDDRRFFILSLSDAKMQDTGYFNQIKREMDLGGKEALLHLLLSRDISAYNPWSRPHTDALREEKIHSLDSAQAWWVGRLQDGRLCDEHDGWQEQVLVAEILDSYLAFCRSWSYGGRPTATSPSRFGLFLASVCPRGFPHKKQVAGQRSYRSPLTGQMRDLVRPNTYVFPSLEVCRTHWDATFSPITTWGSTDLEEGPAAQQSVPF